MTFYNPDPLSSTWNSESHLNESRCEVDTMVQGVWQRPVLMEGPLFMWLVVEPPIWKIWVQLEILNRGENKKYLKPPPNYIPNHSKYVFLYQQFYHCSCLWRKTDKKTRGINDKRYKKKYKKKRIKTMCPSEEIHLTSLLQPKPIFNTKKPSPFALRMCQKHHPLQTAPVPNGRRCAGNPVIRPRHPSGTSAGVGVVGGLRVAFFVLAGDG